MNIIERYNRISVILASSVITDWHGKTMSNDDVYHILIEKMKNAPDVWFIGNGGSAAIASHMAEDYTKNGNVRSHSFNDAALLTCYANDYGRDDMFMMMVAHYAKKGDVVVCISSSGESKNIINAAYFAKEMGCMVVTLSGFSADNRLRKVGDINFHVPAKKGEYGVTEISHLSILHTILDFICERKI